MRRRLLIASAVLAVLVTMVLIYTSSLIGVRAETVDAYRALEAELARQGMNPSFLVVSGRRYAFDNYLLSFGGASRKSRHLAGDAIDLVVLDVDRDGKATAKDVDIVYRILDRQIIGDRGGIGTYKGESGFFNRQMVHLDLRGYRARWHR